jgi:hypothetical protein
MCIKKGAVIEIQRAFVREIIRRTNKFFHIGKN